jgi:hypothetical protein
LSENEFIWHLILTAEVASLTRSHEIIRLICATSCHRYDMIARRCISSAPVALIAITLKYAQSYLLPVCAVSFALAVHSHGLMVAIGFEEFPRFAWSGVSVGNIAKRPVNLTVSI